MKEETNWKQCLTEEVLKECWHESKITENSSCSCGRPYHLGTPYDHHNRTFDNRNDLMDLYEETKKAGKWEAFTVYSNNVWWKEGVEQYYNDVEQAMAYYNAWLFCLGNEDYESRCKLVAEFYGYKETKAVLERLKGRKHPEDHPDVELMHENDNIPGDLGFGFYGLKASFFISGVDHVTGVSPPSNHELMRVINQIIEQQNRIVDYLNQETHGCLTKYCHHG